MLVACLIKDGKKAVRSFSTMTDELLRLLDWLTAEGCTQVAIESTGVYWRPVFNILEGSLEVMLVNARDAKGFKARKTDVIDAEWLADLLRHGLLKPSFIPPLHIRELRELTRYRESLVREQTALSNRIQKLIESGPVRSLHDSGIANARQCGGQPQRLTPSRLMSLHHSRKPLRSFLVNQSSKPS
jgi:transposase